MSNGRTEEDELLVHIPDFHHFLGRLRSKWLMRHGIPKVFSPIRSLITKEIHRGLGSSDLGSAILDENLSTGSEL